MVSGSLDKTVCVFDFNSKQLLKTIRFESCVNFLKLHRQSNILAVITDDLCIRILDLESFRIIREFWGHEARITDATFSHDGRWLISCGLDSTIRTWDLPSSYLIDIFQVPHVPTSVSFSPTSEFLVSTHVDQLGLFVWANRSLYENVPIRNMGIEKVRKLDMPLVNGTDEQGKNVFLNIFRIIRR